MPKPESNSSPSEQKPENMSYGDMERAVSRAPDESALRKLTREIKERVGIPNHDEISKAYEGGTFERRARIAEGLLSKVFGEAEIKGLGGKFTHIPSPNESGSFVAFNGDTRSDGKPQFYVTEVWDEKRTIWGAKAERVRTNEAVVTVRLNNSTNPAENTVIVAVLGHKNGAIDVKNGTMSGLFEVMSEADYLMRLTKSDYTSKVLTGELSSKKYKEEVGKSFGTSFKGYHKERDRNLGKEYANWVSNEVSPRLLDKLQIRYETLLQESRKRQDEIREQVEAERAAIGREADKRVKSTLTMLKDSGVQVDTDLEAKISASVEKALNAEIRRARKEEEKEKKKRRNQGLGLN
ncbi:hypothetical protein A3H26_01265 [candidate division WWE3 bacterium RIFCSPLOWO2_12_FULL_36_10]|uniref:Uncharacterized protein n=1 Tax=candidate division WWE3 bacterium RIFCSPLOWO2_12_FULL_36_10 TaxID=1802630 RepID=A0A1F4VJI5_UNCKA|nr:MAG: hypothetical protein A3H26_01265 [candidate division WWE3 bacterium RIFCSPLOWO2_12_FULL_36_10]